MLRRIWLAIICALGAAWSAAVPGYASGPLTVTSPDGNIAITFELKSNPQPYLSGERAYYRVSYKGCEVLGDSPLGLDFRSAKALDQDFAIVGSDRQSQESAWENQIQPAPGRITFAQRNRELVVMVRHMAFCTQRIFPGGLL